MGGRKLTFFLWGVRVNVLSVGGELMFFLRGGGELTFFCGGGGEITFFLWRVES